ncbi:MAG: phasin family protein [Ardenticatenaceae bacterium]|nr:phasin family protein [Anaerolineales bacterium]MCB8937691.1 phasin family protein [Ardenticatenaceae bacterium]MCB8974260.1 phasin family protein [Ardenticatenaceae bacterium]
MAEKIQIEEEAVEETKNPFVEGVRRVLLAGVGVVSMAQDEAEKFVHKLIEKGEIAEKDGRSLLNDLAENRKQRAQESGKRVSDELEKRMEGLLNRMNIPTKSDIEQLSNKVAELTKKIDTLKEQK